MVQEGYLRVNSEPNSIDIRLERDLASCYGVNLVATAFGEGALSFCTG
jgi:hypothetical protein